MSIFGDFNPLDPLKDLEDELGINVPTPLDIVEDIPTPLDVVENIPTPRDVMSNIPTPVDFVESFPNPIDFVDPFPNPIDAANQLQNPINVATRIHRQNNSKNNTGGCLPVIVGAVCIGFSVLGSSLVCLSMLFVDF
ncbi:hypothetical protein [Allocoleopsis sp.]|uniref:hypothetical protein n=1 Tax=Allocoleopsis sp. TaxID=3088169 RepID=UPI002FCED2B6